MTAAATRRHAPALGDTVVVHGENLTVRSIGGEPGRYIYLGSRHVRGETQVSAADLRWDATRRVWVVAG